MPKMPEKSPEFWVALAAALREHGLAMMLTFVLSYIRIHLYGDKKSPLAKLLEATFGALLIMLVGLGVNAMGANLAWTLFAAGLIGLLGVDQVRALAGKWAERKVSQ
jgi:lambda family phage holin